MRVAAFDLAGFVAVVGFASVLFADLPDLRWEAQEIDLRLDPAELDAGFREGVQWHSIYRDDAKVGFIRSVRRRANDGGIEFSTHTELPRAGNIELDVTAQLDAKWRLRRFRADARTPLTRLEADGQIVGKELVVEVSGALQRTLRFPLGDAPTFDFSMTPLLMRQDLEVGSRVRFDVFDPASMASRPVELEYLGRESISIMGEPVPAHHLRQRVAGQTLETWVNELGEVLREQLPGGLTSIRESEAEATFFEGATAQ
jgi:hypothetical protein